MAFRTYQSLGEVQKAYTLRRDVVNFPAPFPMVKAPQSLHDDVAFTVQHVAYKVSEAAVCENLIYPILREVWKPYLTVFAIWSHQPISLTDELSGIPDYLFTKRSELGPIVFETPYIAVAEAKRDDFYGGWAQCVLEMYAMQQLNQDVRPVFGIVSNGDSWQVGQLEGSVFTEFTDLFTLRKLDELFSALTYVLETCKRIYNL